MEKNKLNFLYTKIEKDMIVAETKDAIKIRIKYDTGDSAYVWIQKKYAFPSKYTTTCNISLVEGWEYELKNLDNKLIEKMKAKELKFELEEN